MNPPRLTTEARISLACAAIRAAQASDPNVPQPGQVSISLIADIAGVSRRSVARMEKTILLKLREKISPTHQ